MCKTIRGCILFFGLSFFYSIVLSMQQDDILLQFKQLVPQISVLSINNYIVNVSSAYEGLKREIFLTNDVIKKINFERINRNRLRKSAINFLYRVPVNLSYIKHSHPTAYPNFMYIYARCTSLLQQKKIVVNMDIVPMVYTINCRNFTPICCIGKREQLGDKSYKLICRIIEAAMPEILKKGNQGRYGVELYHDKRISDWLIIENTYEHIAALKQEEYGLRPAYNFENTEKRSKKFVFNSFILGAIVLITILGLSQCS